MVWVIMLNLINELCNMDLRLVTSVGNNMEYGESEQDGWNGMMAIWF